MAHTSSCRHSRIHFIFSLDHSYEGLIENQPIGLSLFEEFCSKDPACSRCHEFMKELDKFALVAEEKGATTAEMIYEEFLSPEVSSHFLIIEVRTLVIGHCHSFCGKC